MPGPEIVYEQQVVVKQSEKMKIVECGTEESVESARPMAPPYTNQSQSELSIVNQQPNDSMLMKYQKSDNEL